MTRPRLRELGITIGVMPTGKHNAITDVPGVCVGHCTLIYDRPRIARTGITVIMPSAGKIWEQNVFAAAHVLNGDGEMTGTQWLDEFGLLTTPIALTNTDQVGMVRDVLVDYEVQSGYHEGSILPVVTETSDNYLNDISAFHLTKAHVYEAISESHSGPVAEGNVGGGTGMICHDFKGGIGTASRIVQTPSGQFTVGVLMQTNYGDRHLLRVDGVPVGREIGPEHTPFPWEESQSQGSVIAVIATDAPLIPNQCKRLAQRASVGLARVGCIGHNGSGDLFLAFATGNSLPVGQKHPYDLKMLPHSQMNPFFEAVAEAVEEAVLNSLTAAETMTGYRGRIAYALPLDELQRVMAKYHPSS
ncbi:MAG: P1 family peptidase [Anaerolineae bacterium]|nr:P1 family peptidase [Anaerolineae bacterium]